MPLIARRTGGTKRLAIFFLALLPIVGLIGIVIFSRAAPAPIFVPRPVTFAPGLHMLGELSPSVAYVVETVEGLILIDTGLDEHHDLLLQQFKMLGLDIQDLKMILVTHGHGDHYLGALNLQRLTGAKLYAGQGDSHVLRDAGPREAVFSTFPMDHVQIHSTAVDVELVGGETIELGDARIRVIATPGHTPGSVCFWLERQGRTALFSGDTIMSITGDLGTYSTYLAPRYRGDPHAYLTTLRELAELPVPDLLLPGHPRIDQEIVSAKISQPEWSSLLGQGIQRMEELTQRYATDGADFLDGNPKQLLPGLFYLGDCSGMAMYCVADQESLVLFDAPGGPELVGFLDRQLGAIGRDLTMLGAVVLTSAGSESVGGIVPLVEKTGCQIIAAPVDLEEVSTICPQAALRSPEDAVADFDWLRLQPIPVEGCGRPLTVYGMRWQGKQLLVSGLAPLKLTRALIPKLERMAFDPGKFLPSLQRVQRVEPDLWLPGRPMHGQNANLYDSDWYDMLRQNRLFLGLGTR